MKPLNLALKEQETFLKQILKQWRSLSSGALSVSQLIKELEKDSQRLKEHYKTACKIVSMEVSKFKPDFERIKMAPPIETKTEPEPEEAFVTFIKEEFEILYDYLNNITNAFINAHKKEQAEDKESIEKAGEVRKIHWIGSERELVYLFHLLWKNNKVVEDSEKFVLISTLFKNKRGKAFNPIQLANAYQQMKPNYDEIDAIYSQLELLNKKESNQD